MNNVYYPDIFIYNNRTPGEFLLNSPSFFTGKASVFTIFSLKGRTLIYNFYCHSSFKNMSVPF